MYISLLILSYFLFLFIFIIIFIFHYFFIFYFLTKYNEVTDNNLSSMFCFLFSQVVPKNQMES